MPDLAIKRLLQAQSNAFFLNISGRVLVLGCAKPELLKVLNFREVTICHPEKDIIRRAEDLNFCTLINTSKLTKLKLLRSVCTSIVFITKSRRETLLNIAMAFSATNWKGNIIITGGKKEGIEYALGELKKIVEPCYVLSKAHGKIGLFKRPELIPQVIRNWKKQGRLLQNNSGFVTAAGTFSEHFVDNGSQLLADQFLGNLYGSIVDLGAGWGFLSAEAIKDSPQIENITLIDSNSNALKSAKVNVRSIKAKFVWLDLEYDRLSMENVDHVLMNPPFHKGQKIDFRIGLSFLNIAKDILRKGGTLWMVFNRKSPYEKSVTTMFPNYEFLKETKSYKVIRARKS